MTILEELEVVRGKNTDGMLVAEEVVEFATDPKTALHDRFLWDDSIAAHQYRIWQAREIIRVAVTIVPKADQQTRAYVSLMADREREGGGYRTMIDVLTDSDHRDALLQEALAELNRLREKYKVLKELAPVFEALTVVERKRLRTNGRKRTLQTSSAGN
ncbi:MAG: hypothetical protein IMZ55_15080 [Acidobacteria bacterium]|nr:hypothetical protein [Acidobacteriota bacterium]